MVPCLSGGAKTITSTHNSLGSSSPSSTLSESSNCPVTIPTRKPRTRRNRPNQKYNEAAALLSTAYPKLFSAKDLNYFSSPAENFFDDSSELLLPFRAINKSEFLLHPDVEPFTFQETERAVPQTGSKFSPNLSAESQTGFFVEDFDAESMLDEEIEEGIIDTIMGDFCVNKESSEMNCNSWCSNVSGFGFGPGLGRRAESKYGFGLHRGVGGALRNGGAMRNSSGNGMNRSNCWGFSTVDVDEISPKFKKPPLSNLAEKKKKKKVEKPAVEAEQPEQSPFPIPSATLGNEPLLKLNYDGVLDAWSGRASPFADECSGLDAQGNDVYARLAEIDLFSEGGREACVLRYKEKRRTRLFCKKIRYQVRKDNADQRPRNKGRFVRRSGSNGKRLREKNK